ncbi:MAG TPA: FAD-dependent monooxygenase [Pseudonocardiaceae bacterium]|nr:FAD-dependent monooxygenase [Pseudonocardiaceae bacterium]
MAKALIIGGGIAGSVTAVALRKVGLDAVVYEAYDKGSDGIGAYLNFGVNGMTALRTLGLGECVDSLGFQTPSMAFYTGGGRKLYQFNHGRLADGTLSRTIKRTDLYGALRDAAIERGVRVEYGRRLVDARTTDAGVTARFADDTEATGDLLIGADGIGSPIRTIIDPDAPPARYGGLLNAGGYATGVSVPDKAGLMHMVFGKRCFFCYIPNPNGEVWWFANLGRASAPSKAELAAITQDQWRAELLDLVRGDSGPATELIKATPHIDAGWPTYDFPSVPTWHNDRMVIIGDAAHAVSPAAGQGASMAIEDAVVLAKCLRDRPTITDAFDCYEGLRRERVERIVAQGKKAGDQKIPGPVSRVLRDHLVLPLVFALQSRGEAEPLDWMFDYRVDWDEPVRPLAPTA